MPLRSSVCALYVVVCDCRTCPSHDNELNSAMLTCDRYHVYSGIGRTRTLIQTLEGKSTKSKCKTCIYTLNSVCLKGTMDVYHPAILRNISEARPIENWLMRSNNFVRFCDRNCGDPFLSLTFSPRKRKFFGRSV